MTVVLTGRCMVNMPSLEGFHGVRRVVYHEYTQHFSRRALEALLYTVGLDVAPTVRGVRSVLMAAGRSTSTKWMTAQEQGNPIVLYQHGVPYLLRHLLSIAGTRAHDFVTDLHSNSSTFRGADDLATLLRGKNNVLSTPRFVAAVGFPYAQAVPLAAVASASEGANYMRDSGFHMPRVLMPRDVGASLNEAQAEELMRSRVNPFMPTGTRAREVDITYAPTLVGTRRRAVKL